MGWNEPDKGKEPWGGKKQPPDLDEALKRLYNLLKKVLSNKSNNKRAPNKKIPSIIPHLINDGSKMIASLTIVILMIIWLLSGIFIIDPAEQAAILRFGRYVKTVGPGPHWLPRFIESKMVINVDKISDYSYSAQMLTQDQNLVSVSIAIQYRIGDLQAYLFNVVDPIGSLQQATSSALRQVVGNTTLDEIITEGREAWGINVQESLIKILEKYKTGIIIVNVSPQPARAPENVQDAFDDAIKAQEDEKRFKEQAYAYQARVVPIAQGNAKRITEEANAYVKQVVLKATGEVAEFVAILPEYLQSPEVTAQRMYFDTMQQVLTKSTKVIVDGKANNMLYLPLDKLSPLTPPNLVSNLKKQAAQMDATTSNIEPTIVSGRDIIRHTIRQGRNN
jgi:membrane protease subunit HflK